MVGAGRDRAGVRKRGTRVTNTAPDRGSVVLRFKETKKAFRRARSRNH